MSLTVELGRAPLVAVSRTFWNHRQLHTLFPEYLFHLYGAMRASVPLMEAACARAGDLSHSDAVASQVERYLREHIEEEREHADWLLEDMVHLGVHRDDVLNRTPPTSVAALIGTQYYWALHVHPVYLLAYLVVLEGDPMARASIEQYAEPAGIPAGALRTLLMHAETDLHHRDELYDVLDRMPLTDTHARLLGMNALQVMGQLTGVFENVLQAAPPAS